MIRIGFWQCSVGWCRVLAMVDWLVSGFGSAWLVGVGFDNDCFDGVGFLAVFGWSGIGRMVSGIGGERLVRVGFED